ncbi:hypothetical protein [Aeromicrobium sp.]|uniref:hypothetical protein n=1 Tax=Aeromicrobium sp. TaxID=1871063 RepID=UPI0019B10E26|nr:hypothetical protein [Aeromicrobium sp.]MBC7632470.1 hypothetical protein [Aeromicrobium sp.]
MSLLRHSVLPALGVTLVCAVVAAFVVGAQGVGGALVGGVMVCVFFASSPIVLGPISKVSPHLSLAVAMTFFLTKIIALVALMTVLLDPEGLGRHLDRKALGVTVIVTTLAWTFLRVLASTRERVPLYDLRDTQP